MHGHRHQQLRQLLHREQQMKERRETEADDKSALLWDERPAQAIEKRQRSGWDEFTEWGKDAWEQIVGGGSRNNNNNDNNNSNNNNNQNNQPVQSTIVRTVVVRPTTQQQTPEKTSSTAPSPPKTTAKPPSTVSSKKAEPTSSITMDKSVALPASVVPSNSPSTSLSNLVVATDSAPTLDRGASATSSSPTSSGTAAASNSENSSSGGSDAGSKAGIAFGVIGGILIVFLLAWLAVRHRKKKMEGERQMLEDDEKINGPFAGSSSNLAPAAGAAAAGGFGAGAKKGPRLSLKPVPAGAIGSAEGGGPVAYPRHSPSAWERPRTAGSANPANPFGRDAERLDTPFDDANPYPVSPVSPGASTQPSPNASSVFDMAPTTPTAATALNPAPPVSGGSAIGAAAVGIAAGAAVGAIAVGALKRKASIRKDVPQPLDLTVGNQPPMPAVPPSPAGTEFSVHSVAPGQALGPSSGAAAIAAAGGPTASTVHRVELDFKPTAEDEMELRAGSLVRLLFEYDDGWALCIRLDRTQQGVVPRTCLSTRPLKPRPGPGARPGPPVNPSYGPPRPGHQQRPSNGAFGPQRSMTGGPGAYGPPQHQQPHPPTPNRSMTAPGPMPQSQSPHGNNNGSRSISPIERSQSPLMSGPQGPPPANAAAPPPMQPHRAGSIERKPVPAPSGQAY